MKQIPGILKTATKKSTTLLATCILVCSSFAGPTAASNEKPPRAEYFDETQAITLFAFDDKSIPFTRNLKLHMRSPQRHRSNPVVKWGAPNSPDAWAVQFYGSVIRDAGRFRMWYVAAGNDRLDAEVPRSSPWRVAYAESNDGVLWTKPKLGLVDYRGNRENNLVLMEPRLGTINLKVLFEPAEPDLDRRYKMAAHVWFPKDNVRLGTLAPYASRDGLRWNLLVEAKPIEAELPQQDMVLPALHFEPAGGLYKWDGLYHLSGQNAISASRPYHGRVAREIVSADFVNWSQSSAITFVRSSQHTLLGPGQSRAGEQTHEGISVWNRGNVLVGLSGMWHGGKEWQDVTIDLGIVISNDGVHFREPLHEWVFLKRGEDGQWDQGGLLQGQGFENVDTHTYIYYGAWDPRRWQSAPPRGGVGIATLPRDRFADLVVDQTNLGNGTYQVAEIVSELITTSVHLRGNGPRRFYVNADGLGDEAYLKIELLSHSAIPLPKFSGQNAAIIRESGFQSPIAWNKVELIRRLPERVRIKATFLGRESTSIRCSAIYVR